MFLIGGNVNETEIFYKFRLVRPFKKFFSRNIHTFMSYSAELSATWQNCYNYISPTAMTCRFFTSREKTFN